ncbi:MAG: 50S ribosomal protein L18 [Flavobacteriales bacterium]|nr:50S ribosomal protein L18 [Flavobacteriales bacterium]MDG1933279.1 50S ribosomal protein L18 [Flavobacteriales bacterium]MDG2086593.1 50S ribosomal protein L18 [Flavobacteriales bacterium]|tara:strand:+ start:1243 stop:1581 length:339 start_codon:yes stop_codon:yes gene_type:complete
MQSKKEARKRVRFSIRKKVSGTSERPRLAVFRSNKEIYAQLIDDVSNVTLTSASSADSKGTKTEQASVVGKLIADNALKAGISSVVFDRGGFLYHGRVKALAESAREGGLKF